MSLYHELKRRNVFRVAIAYLALAWLLTEVSGTVFPVFGIPDWGVRLVVILSALGFVPALIISWVYELTPQGIKRETDVVRDESITHLTAKRLDVFTIGLIVVALAFIFVDRLWLSPRFEQQITTPAESVTDTGQTSEHQYPTNSIAVLPFVNMSDDASNEYFSDGISEELLNVLAKVPELRVIARTSTFAFKGRNAKISDIASELNVSHVLEGSVRKSGNRVRITAQLIHTTDSSHLWSATYDRTLDDVFAIQNEIANVVVHQMKDTLLEQVPKTQKVDPEAFTLFLQGRYLIDLGSAEGIREATTSLQRALAIDPSHAQSWSELGKAYSTQAFFNLLPRDEAFAKTIEALDKAIALDPGNATAYSRKGWVKVFYEGDLVSAAELLQRALYLEPGNTSVLVNSSTLLSTLWRLDESIALQEKALLRDPLNPGIHSNLGNTYTAVNRYREAEAMLRKSLLLSPEAERVRAHLGRVLILQNRPDEAIDLLEEEPSEPMKLMGLAIAYYALGRTEESDAALDKLVAEYADTAARFILAACASRGELDSALQWLGNAYRIEGPRALLNTRQWPELDKLRADPRFQQMLMEAEFSEDELNSISFDAATPKSNG